MNVLNRLKVGILRRGSACDRVQCLAGGVRHQMNMEELLCSARHCKTRDWLLKSVDKSTPLRRRRIRVKHCSEFYPIEITQPSGFCRDVQTL